MLESLRKDLKDDSAKFAFIVLVDDFTGSGKSLHRLENEIWKGKLEKCWNDVSKKGDSTPSVLETHFESCWTLIVHHYVATVQALATIRSNNELRKANSVPNEWYERVLFTNGLTLPVDMKLTSETYPAFGELVSKYYDASIETVHMRVGGGDAKWGFGSCGLPLVLEHNTPNNSIALLWAESEGKDEAHPMRPLFRRRQRHI